MSLNVIQRLFYKIAAFLAIYKLCQSNSTAKIANDHFVENTHQKHGVAPNKKHTAQLKKATVVTAIDTPR